MGYIIGFCIPYIIVGVLIYAIINGSQEQTLTSIK